MKSVRLIPVVIFAALALLVFKGIGLVTNGGYVLTGTTVAAAAEGGGGGEAAGSTVSGDPTVADSAPTLQDSTPTLGAPEGAGVGEHGAPAGGDASAGGHGASDAAASGGEHGAAAAEGGSSAASGDHGASGDAAAGGHGGSSEAAASAVPCLNPDAAPAASGGENAASTAVAPDTACATPSYPTDANGDAVPMVADNQGHLKPLQDAAGQNSEDALLKRLADRRAELDKREADLQTRQALLDAAEKKLDEKTKQLEAMQAQISALVDQKKAADDAGFSAIVSMYAQMKPKQAAAIFDTLDLGVLLRVARAMDPRKMSPILAVMSPAPAEALTTALATPQAELTVPAGASGENLAALPQIVGQ